MLRYFTKKNNEYFDNRIYVEFMDNIQEERLFLP